MSQNPVPQSACPAADETDPPMANRMLVLHRPESITSPRFVLSFLVNISMTVALVALVGVVMAMQKKLAVVERHSTTIEQRLRNSIDTNEKATRINSARINAISEAVKAKAIEDDQ